MAAYDDLNVKRIFIVGILSIVVTAVTALAVQVVYYSLVEWHEADLAEKSSYRRQNKVLADQTAQISSYGVDPETGNVTIPISKAMELIAANNPKSDDDHDPGHDESGHKVDDHAPVETGHAEVEKKAADKKAADKKAADKKAADEKAADEDKAKGAKSDKKDADKKDETDAV